MLTTPKFITSANIFLPKFRFSILLRGLKDTSISTCLYGTPHLCLKLTTLTAFPFQLIASLSFKLLGPDSSVILDSFLSLMLNIHPSENSVGSSFNIYPESILCPLTSIATTLV